MIKKPKIQIIDIDDTIVYMAPKWILSAMQHPAIMKRTERLNIALESTYDHNLFFSEVFSRPFYDLIKFLGISDTVADLFYKSYTENGQFYDDLPLSSFGASLVSGGVGNKLIFLTHVIDGLCNQSKEKWVKKNFGMLDYEYVELPLKESKGAYIEKNFPDFDTFVDDNPMCLLDVAERFKSQSKYIAFPEFGYNKAIMEGYAESLQDSKLTIKSFLPKW